MSDTRSIFLMLFLAFGPLFLTACTGGGGHLVGHSQRDLDHAVSLGATSQNLFVATTRLRSEDPTEFFTGERSRLMGLGNVNVTIPPVHQTGKIERPRSGRNDVTRHFAIGQPVLHEGSQGFISQINQALAKRPVEDRNILVFVHGYNTNFSSAVLRISQFVHDSGFTGVPVLFTWASRGKTIDYVYDINSALQARFYLEELAGILSKTNAREFNVVAHSMGNLVTLETMSALHKNSDARRFGRLRNIILAAPDVDFDLFIEQLKNLQPVKRNIFLLVSKDDKALRFSRRIAGGVSRVGATDPARLAALGLKVIDLSKISDKSSANHSKFADSPEIVQLIGRGINNGNTLSTGTHIQNQVGNLVGSTFLDLVRIPSALTNGNSGGVLTVGN